VAGVGRKPAEGGFGPAAHVTCYDSSRGIAIAVVVVQGVLGRSCPLGDLEDTGSQDFMSSESKSQE